MILIIKSINIFVNVETLFLKKEDFVEVVLKKEETIEK